MSHTVATKIELKGRKTIELAVQSMREAGHNVTLLDGDVFRMYDGRQATGLGVSLPGWNYPVVISPETGEVTYDNYNGRWGEQIELDRLFQQFVVENARQYAEDHGYRLELQHDAATGEITGHLEQSLAAY